MAHVGAGGAGGGDGLRGAAALAQDRDVDGHGAGRDLGGEDRRDRAQALARVADAAAIAAAVTAVIVPPWGTIGQFHRGSRSTR